MPVYGFLAAFVVVLLSSSLLQYLYREWTSSRAPADSALPVIDFRDHLFRFALYVSPIWIVEVSEPIIYTVMFYIPFLTFVTAWAGRDLRDFIRDPAWDIEQISDVLCERVILISHRYGWMVALSVTTYFLSPIVLQQPVLSDQVISEINAYLMTFVMYLVSFYSFPASRPVMRMLARNS